MKTKTKRKPRKTVGYILDAKWGPALVHRFNGVVMLGSGGGKNRFASLFPTRAAALAAINADGNHRVAHGYPAAGKDGQIPQVVRVVLEVPEPPAASH